MKNKVMGKALSWVLSAAMALTMSGAIPAMTTSVYAAETTTTSQFADVYAKSEAVKNDTIKFGATVSDSEYNPVVWKVLDNHSAGKDYTSGVLNLRNNTGVKSADWEKNTAAYFTTAQLALFKSVNIDTDARNDYQSVTYNETLKATIHDPGVSGVQFYLPSANEAVTKTLADDETTWTRDELKDATGATTGYAAAATGTAAEILATTDANARYYAVGNLDLTDRSKTLLTTTASDVTTLTMIDSSVEQPKVDSYTTKVADSNTIVTVKLTAAPTDTTLKAGWFTTALDYTKATTVVGSAVDAAIDKDNKTITLTIPTSQYSGNKVNIYYYKTATDTVTNLASTPVNVTDNGKAAVATSNFKVDSIAYTGTELTLDQAKTDALTKVSLVADSGYTTTFSANTIVTIDKIQKSGVDVTSKLTFKVGDTYTLIGSTKEWTETLSTDTTKSKTFAAASNVTLGTLTVTPAKIDSIASSDFTLPAVAQYSATSYTLDTVALNAANNTSIADTDKVNATKVKVVLDSTDTAGTTAATATVYFSTVDNANYTIDGTIKVASVKVAVTQAAMTGISIARMPSTTTYVENATPSMDGLEIKCTYEGNGSQYVVYGTATQAAFSFSPSLATKQVAGTVAYTVSYTDPASKKVFTASDKVTDTFVTKAVSLSKITVPSTSTINIKQSLDLPSVRYTPTDTTVAKNVKWYYKAGTGSLSFVNDNNGAASVASEDTTLQAGSGSIILDGTTQTGNLAVGKAVTDVTKMVGATAGDSKLYAVVEDGNNIYVAMQTVTIDSVNAAISYKRVFGDTRYLTAAAIAKEAVGNSAVTSVVLVSGENFPDALAANGFAGAMGDLPILITASKSLSSETAALIDDWGVETVYIIGGTSAVSTAVETSLKSDHKVANVKRIFGDDRYGTAKNVYINGSNWNPDYCVVTTGESAADALSISPWAYSMAMPIFLTGKDKTLDSTSLSLIGAKYNGKTVFILGGTKAVDSSVETALKSAGVKTVTRLYGDDRYQTSAKIAAEFGTTLKLSTASYNYTCFANGENAHTVDALVGGMLAGYMGDSGKTKASPLILVNGTTGAGFDLVSSTLVKSGSEVSKIYFLGGTAALTEDSAKAVLSNWASATLGTWKITDQ